MFRVERVLRSKGRSMHLVSVLVILLFWESDPCTRISTLGAARISHNLLRLYQWLHKHLASGPLPSNARYLTGKVSFTKYACLDDLRASQSKQEEYRGMRYLHTWRSTILLLLTHRACVYFYVYGITMKGLNLAPHLAFADPKRKS